MAKRHISTFDLNLLAASKRCFRVSKRNGERSLVGGYRRYVSVLQSGLWSFNFSQLQAMSLAGPDIGCG